MKLLLVGEDRQGALLRSFEAGLRLSADVTVLDPALAVTELIDRTSVLSRLRRRRRAVCIGDRFLEAVEQLRPDMTLIIKGRGIDAATMRQARRLSRVVIYYPDNPFWRIDDNPDALGRLAAADMAVVWSGRLREQLRQTCPSVQMLPFGYDDDWFPLTTPSQSRSGVAFLGTWSLRRERYLRALGTLPLTVVGFGWHHVRDLRTTPPMYGTSAGEILQRSAIAVNLFHPHNSGAHNMRTREIAGSGALQLTDAGVDGTPLRDGIGCRWFRSPEHLRDLADQYLARPDEAKAMAGQAQDLTGAETYRQRSRELVQLFDRI